jgi:hypothetical protein
MQRWEDHFTVDEANGLVNGVTSIGRATVARLRMNGDTQVSARKEWVRLRLFPTF